MSRMGQTVVYVDRDNDYNGHHDQPAIITKVWSPGCVNLKVLPDCGEPFDVTSVVIKEIPVGDNTPEQMCYWEYAEGHVQE
ncbi:MAG: hypothetical protein LN417_01270 [Candidatus Thermoplasmatota archaeon]|nr:hypothetical protein [Candidatus Thermoplasmatota archaeon]